MRRPPSEQTSGSGPGEPVTVRNDDACSAARMTLVLRGILHCGGCGRPITRPFVNFLRQVVRLGRMWLPNGACSGRIKYGFVIDLDKVRKRLRGRHLEHAEPRPITQTLALADELRDLLETESVNQSQLARRFGMSRARVNQILRLHHLHPAIQEYLRDLRGVGPRYLTERRLRPPELPAAGQSVEAAFRSSPGASRTPGRDRKVVLILMNTCSYIHWYEPAAHAKAIRCIRAECISYRGTV